MIRPNWLDLLIKIFLVSLSVHAMCIFVLHIIHLLFMTPSPNLRFPHMTPSTHFCFQIIAMIQSLGTTLSRDLGDYLAKFFVVRTHKTPFVTPPLYYLFVLYRYL